MAETSYDDDIQPPLENRKKISIDKFENSTDSTNSKTVDENDCPKYKEHIEHPNGDLTNDHIENENKKKTKNRKTKSNKSKEDLTCIEDQDKGPGDELATLRGRRRLRPLSRYANRDSTKKSLDRDTAEDILPTTIGNNSNDIENSGKYSTDCNTPREKTKDSRKKRPSGNSMSYIKEDFSGNQVKSDVQSRKSPKREKSLENNSRKSELDCGSPNKIKNSKSRLSSGSKESLETNRTANDPNSGSPSKTSKPNRTESESNSGSPSKTSRSNRTASEPSSGSPNKTSRPNHTASESNSRSPSKTNRSNRTANEPNSGSSSKTSRPKTARRRSSEQSVNSFCEHSPYNESIELTKKSRERKKSSESINSCSRKLSRSNTPFVNNTSSVANTPTVTNTPYVTNYLEASLENNRLENSCEKSSMKCSQKSLKILVDQAKDSNGNADSETPTKCVKTESPNESAYSPNSCEEGGSILQTSNDALLNENNHNEDPLSIKKLNNPNSFANKKLKKSHVRKTPSNDNDNFYDDDVFIDDAPLSTSYLTYSEQPVEVVCRFCRITVTSQIETESKLTIYFTSCLILCFSGILNCCYSSCCMPSFRDVRHKCPICYTVLGAYRSPMKKLLRERLLTKIVNIDLSRPSIDSKSELVYHEQDQM